MIGWVVMGAWIVLVGAVPELLAVLAGWAIWGFGHTFTSGPIRPGSRTRWGSRASVASSCAGSSSATWEPSRESGSAWCWRAPTSGVAVAAGGVLTIAFAAFAALAMPETGFRRRPAAERAHALRELSTTAGAGARFVRARPLLLLILGIAFFAGVSTESFDRLWQAHVLEDIGLPGLGSLDPVVWFGILGVVTMVIGLVATQLLVRRFERAGRGGPGAAAPRDHGAAGRGGRRLRALGELRARGRRPVRTT